MASDKPIIQYCIQCHGTGKTHNIVTPEGQPPVEEEYVCDTCKGTGKIVWGYVKEKKESAEEIKEDS